MNQTPARSRLWIVAALVLNLIALAAIAYSLGLIKLPGLFRGKAEQVASGGSEQAPSGTMSLSMDIPPPILPLSETSPLDWTSLRGTWGNCTSPETGLIDTFQATGGEGSNVLWKRADLASNTTPIVMWDKLYIVVRDQVDGQAVGERIACVNVNTGDTDWQNRLGPGLPDTPHESVGASALAGDIAITWVYILSAGETLRCVDGVTGQIVWTVPLREAFGMSTTPTGVNRQPLVYDNLVIVGGMTAGWGAHSQPAYRYMAFDRMKGALVWISACPPNLEQPAESAATIAMFQGRKHLMGADASGHVWAVQPATGLPVWTFNGAGSGVVSAPRVDGDRIFVSQLAAPATPDAAATLLALKPAGTGDLPAETEVWRVPRPNPASTAPLCVDQRLYLVDETGTLTVLDAKTGQAVGNPYTLGAPASGNLLYADGKIYAVTKTGHWVILRPDPSQGIVQVSAGDFPAGETCVTSPICSHGKIFIATSGALYCLKDEKKTETEPVLAHPLEEPTSGDRQATHLVLVPPFATLISGNKLDFEVRAYDSAGGTVPAKQGAFTVDGPGTIDAKGTYQVPKDAQEGIATVTVTVGDLVAQSQVRIVQQLPWEFTWDDQATIPNTWAGVSPRWSVRDVSGSPALVCAAAPDGEPATRCWIGPSVLRNCTFQADVRSTSADGKLPSPGLIVQGHSLVLNGQTAQLELRRWSSQPDQNPSASFPWQADTWYVLKLRTQIMPNGHVALQGKVWPRDSEEPSDWLVEMTDSAPTQTGSAGLECPATPSEIAFDNLRVSTNSPPGRSGKRSR